MNPTTPCSSASMLPNCSIPDPNNTNTTKLGVETGTIRSEMETDSSLDIFGSLPDILSIPYFKVASPTTGFSPISCNEESRVSCKRKFTETDDDDYRKCLPNNIGEISGDLRREKYDRNFKRTRSADMHNIYERRRRDKIKEKMKALQELIPHSHKEEDKASMLDHAIHYLKALKLQVEMMSNMLRGASYLCQTPWMSAAPSVCLYPVMLMNPAPRIGMLSACSYGDVPRVHLPLVRQPFICSPPPLLGGPTSTPRPIASSDQVESIASRE